MRNYVQPGHSLPLVAPYDLLSGQGFLVGSFFAVAATDALSGTSVEGDLEGVFDLPKADTQAWTQYAPVYWDATAKVCTNTSNSNANKLIGAAVLPVASSAGLTTGRVRLNGVAVA